MDYQNDSDSLRQTTVKINAPIAMAYVPMQRFKDLFSPEIAYKKGTVFAELYLPFEGRESQ